MPTAQIVGGGGVCRRFSLQIFTPAQSRGMKDRLDLVGRYAERTRHTPYHGQISCNPGYTMSRRVILKIISRFYYDKMMSPKFYAHTAPPFDSTPDTTGVGLVPSTWHASGLIVAWSVGYASKPFDSS